MIDRPKGSCGVWEIPKVLRGGAEYPRGGGGSIQVQRGVAPALRISREKGSFLRPPHVRDFEKEGGGGG